MTEKRIIEPFLKYIFLVTLGCYFFNLGINHSNLVPSKDVHKPNLIFQEIRELL